MLTEGACGASLQPDVDACSVITVLHTDTQGKQADSKSRQTTLSGVCLLQSRLRHNTVESGCAVLHLHLNPAAAAAADLLLLLHTDPAPG